MSTAGIKRATISPNALSAAALNESNVSSNTITNTNVLDCTQLQHNENENSSFCNLTSLKELHSSLYNEQQQNNLPLGNSKKKGDDLPEDEVENSHTSAFNRELTDFPSDFMRQGDVENNTSQIYPGLGLLQQSAAASSPPPHSYRHSRAYRHFKNPPQPHMCIRTTTESGEELFINVLSWTRIVIPQEPSDPIPLYGGMRVPPGSPRSPPIVFAVMANPEVLKDSGRHSKDQEERRAMVELMCDFVEAMNPGVKLVRNAIILKDRDISGELKDVWNAVQAQRDREREEQMLQQRQQHQQHFHNISNGSSISNTSLPAASINSVTQQISSKSLHTTTPDEDMLMIVDSGNSHRNRTNIHEVQIEKNSSNIDVDKNIEMTRTNNDQVSLAISAEHLDNKMSIGSVEKSEECSTKQHNSKNLLTNDALTNGNNSKDHLVTEGGGITDISNQLNTTNCNSVPKKEEQTLTNGGSVAKCNDTLVLNVSKTLDGIKSPNSAIAIPAQNPPTNNAPFPTTQQAPTKKEKLGGFLPNGCIFPRFTKNNKHKDKDKDKEHKTKDKEKNALLSALKKSKDKKANSATTNATATYSSEKNTSSNSKITAANCNQSNIKQQLNCLQQLECGVQKLDINNHHQNTNIVGSNITSNNSETNKNASSTSSSSDSVGVQ